MAKKTETAIDQSAGDQADELAMAAIAADIEAAIIDEETGEVLSGTRARRAWTMKNFLSDPDWINRHVVPTPIGTHTLVGRVVGTVHKSERRINSIEKVGKKEEVQSIALIGLFTAIDLQDRQSTFSMLFLPMAFSEQIEAALAMDDVSAVPLDVDIGLEKTGRTIPYEWTVTSYIEGRAQRALRQLVNRRRIGQPAQPSKPAPRLIEGGRASD